MAHGMQIFDAAGNLMLDTTDNTLKDILSYANAVVTSNGDITGVTSLTPDSIALVADNTGGTIDVPIVEPDYLNNKIKVYYGNSGFDASIRMMEF
jgi:hypothetical protein